MGLNLEWIYFSEKQLLERGRDKANSERICGGVTQTFHVIASIFKPLLDSQNVKSQFQSFRTFLPTSFHDAISSAEMSGQSLDKGD